MTVTGTDFHQCEYAASRPRSDRATLHLVFVRLIKRFGYRRTVIAVQLFPSVPQIHAVRPAFHRLEFARTPKRVIQRAAQHAVIVQNRADINHIKLGTDRAQRQDGLFKPHFQLVALVGVTHHLVVFDIVEDGEVGTEWTMHHAAHFLTRAEDLDFDV